MTPTVSVIIPCFNLGAYLDEAVQSVLDQTYGDFEIVIVDDGSDDPFTRSLLKTYERPHTRILETENRGVACARNLGLSTSRGRYVSFLDADDLLEERFLERTVAVLDADTSAAFASCWLTAFGAAEFAWTPDDCGLPHLLAEDTVCTAALTRRDVLLSIGGFDPDERVDGYEDWDLAISLVERGHTGVIIPEFLFRYRIREGSKTSTRTVPDNHARVMEYLVEKHAEAYRRYDDGVCEVIERRAADLEALVADRPARPDIGDSSAEDGWKRRIFALEAYRRDLEERASRSRSAAPAAVEWGTLRRLEPVSRSWGLDRGQPVDRYYIEDFLEANQGAVRGDVLEVKDAAYTQRFGSELGRVDVVDIAPRNADATIRADLGAGDSLPPAGFDCFILTQTLQFISDPAAAIRNVFRALRPDGVVLATLPCVSRIDSEPGLDGDRWRFTPASARQLFAEAFGERNVHLEVYGNVLACTAFLQGLAAHELTPEELEFSDPYFPLLVAVRATKPGPTAEPASGAGTVEGHLDAATCHVITGWARSPGQPGSRLRVEIWADEKRLGSAVAERRRDDLVAAGKGEGRVAFAFRTPARLHDGRPHSIRVAVAGSGAPLTGSPRMLECVCADRSRCHASTGASERGRGAVHRIEVSKANLSDPAIAGHHIDLPSQGSPIAFPWLSVVGWVLGRERPVEAVELSYAGSVVRRIPVGMRRPDLREAFPSSVWADRAGFSAQVSLLGLRGRSVLELVAVAGSGSRVPLGSIELFLDEASDGGSPLVVVIDPTNPDADDWQSVLGQREPPDDVFVGLRDRVGPLGHPGLKRLDRTGPAGWNDALRRAGDGFLWLSDGDDPADERFLQRAVDALRGKPDAVFVAADANGDRPDGDVGLDAALSGSALGSEVLLRAAAAREVGGFDASAGSAPAGLWDLCIRMTLGGPRGRLVAGPGVACVATLAERSGAAGARWVHERHSDLLGERLERVLLEREASIGSQLRSNHELEGSIELNLRPRLHSLRRERDRLARKLQGIPESTRIRHGRKSDSMDWGDLRRLEPVSAAWGSERGLSIARYYIEPFLQRHAGDIRGTALEVEDSVYARRYGGKDLMRCDVIDIDPTNPRADIVCDIRCAPELGSESYDCVILTQVLSLVYDVESALRECFRVLRPGGTLLVTVPAVSRIDPEYGGLDGDYWRFTERGFRQLLAEVFAPDGASVCAHGNRVAAVAFLEGLSADEVGPARLDPVDPACPLVLSARAVKPADGSSE